MVKVILKGKDIIIHSKSLIAINLFVYFFVSCLSVGKERTLIASAGKQLSFGSIVRVRVRV